MAQPFTRPRIVRFGVFELDLAKAELRKHGMRVRLQEQPFHVLCALLEQPGAIVSREDLVRRLWQDGTHVDFDRSLNAAVTRLRRTLLDSAESPRYIETVARQGYRFLMPVEAVALRNDVEAADAIVDATASPDSTFQNVSRTTSHGKFGIQRLLVYGAFVGAVATIGLALTTVWAARTSTQTLASTGTSKPALAQITDLTDSAIAPAISPDGRTVAFLRSTHWFLSGGQIWLQSLEGGQPVQLTNDPRLKFAPTFSPDGSQLAYSAVEPARTAWDTVTVPVGGGEPRLLLKNAEGLSWIGSGQLLFSEIKKGIHMGVVTADTDRSRLRDVYLPAHERAMAHFSYLSPDGKWVLVIEMDHTATWLRCRLAPFDGTSQGQPVGPLGRCTSAGWSRDGKWMFSTVATQDGQHLWRQRFPDGAPEQITFGPAEAQGVAVAADGRSVITSLGMQQSSVWLKDANGERPISSVGDAFLPKFSGDGHRVYYLLRRRAADSATELWRVDVKTGQMERVVSGFNITGYDVSDDGSEVVFAARPAQGKSQIWIESFDKRSAPVQITSDGEDDPYFGPNGHVVFRVSNGSANYLLRMNRDGSGRSKVVEHPILNVMSISPDRLWIATLVAVNDAQASFAEVAIPTVGGAAMRRICSGFCVARWAPDGKFLYVTLEPGSTSSTRQTVAIPVRAGTSLPELPKTGIRSVADGLRIPGSSVIEHSSLAPGPKPSIHAYVKTTMHRNLFRVTIP